VADMGCSSVREEAAAVRSEAERGVSAFIGGDMRVVVLGDSAMGGRPPPGGVERPVP